MLRIRVVLGRVCFILGLALTTVGAPALAEPAAAEPASQLHDTELESPEEEAKALYAEGVIQFRKGRYDAAIDAFLQADQLQPSAALSYNIARAYDAANAPSDSMYWYLDYLERAPDAPDRADIDVLIKEHERALAQRGVQLLIVRSSPPNAQVLVDGARQGTTPYRALLTPGRYRIQLVLAGYESRELSASLALDRTNALAVELEPEKPKIEATLPLSPQSPQTQGPIRPDNNASSPGAYRPWPMVVTGVGVAGLGAAGVFELLRSNAEDDARGTNVQLEREQAQERMEGHQGTARALAVGGSIVALVGATFWFLDETRGSPEGVALSADLGRGGLEASFTKSF